MRLRKGKIIPRDDGKRIEEFVGNATTQTRSVSVARMNAPPGWKEPAQTPEFDEVVMVLSGELTLVIEGRRERIGAGEVGLVPRGQRVVYRNDADAACDYFSVCAPAFLPQLAHMEAAPTAARRAPRAAGGKRAAPASPGKRGRGANQVTVQVAHAQGEGYAAPLEALARQYLDRLELQDCELSLSLVGDRAIRRLNRTWRKKDKATDVLSFPAGDAPAGTPGPRLLGDVVISLDTARRQAREYERPLDVEMARYLAHGILHLLGHDHEKPSEAKRMATLEERLLGGRGMVVDGVPLKQRRARLT